MNAQFQAWENDLLALAFTEKEEEIYETRCPAPPDCTAAYQLCTAITRLHSRTFYLAASLLPPAKRPAIHALYAFCRISDDIIDHAQTNPLSALANWRQAVFTGTEIEAQQALVALAWRDTIARYRIPQRYIQQLLDGVARDLAVTRYRSFDELAVYCYGVASTVGLMAMRITGYSGPEALPYAIKLSVALQLTNILRDVGEDWRAGRLYLPLDELNNFNLTEYDIAQSKIDERWRAFMRFQISRARKFYEEAWPGIAMLNRDGRLAIAAAADLYKAILQDIEEHDYAVFNRRAHIDTWDKLCRLPSIWWRVQKLTPTIRRRKNEMGQNHRR